jgi:hypothetical protein
MVSRLRHRQAPKGYYDIGSVAGAEEGSHNFFIDFDPFTLLVVTALKSAKLLNQENDCAERPALGRYLTFHPRLLRANCEHPTSGIR